MISLTIGQVAKRAGVGVETVRFYERKGLLESPPRRASGYRQYPPTAARRIRFIKHAQELGFSLREIHELLTLRVAPGTTCGEVKARTIEKLAQVEEKIANLRRMQAALRRLAAACRGAGPSSECPILEELDREEDRRAER